MRPSPSCARSPTGWIPRRRRSTTRCTSLSFLKGDVGMLIMGGWAQGVLQGPAASSTTSSSPRRRSDEGKPVLRAECRCLHLLEAQGSRPAGRPAADRQAGHADPDVQDNVLADHRLDPGAHRRRSVGRRLVGRSARRRRGAERGRQESGRAAQPRAQHGAAKPDLRRHDRRHHRVHAQRQDDYAGTGRHAPRRGRGQARV